MRKAKGHLIFQVSGDWQKPRKELGQETDLYCSGAESFLHCLLRELSDKYFFILRQLVAVHVEWQFQEAMHKGQLRDNIV